MRAHAPSVRWVRSRDGGWTPETYRDGNGDGAFGAEVLSAY